MEIEDTSAAKPVPVVFPCGRWFDKTKDPASLTQTLMPLGADAASSGLVKYSVKTYTSDVRGAGTDANITLSLQARSRGEGDIVGGGGSAREEARRGRKSLQQLPSEFRAVSGSLATQGEGGSSGFYPLEAGRKNLFERNQVDEFVVQAPELGKLASCTVRHDNSGLGPAWHLQARRLSPYLPVASLILSP